LMATVFIGGSRGVLSLPAAVALRIDGLIAKDFLLLVGDANGADKAVQSYLSKREYRMSKCSAPGLHRETISAAGLYDVSRQIERAGRSSSFTWQKTAR